MTLPILRNTSHYYYQFALNFHAATLKVDDLDDLLSLVSDKWHYDPTPVAL